MMNATSPAAKISPMHTDAISASDTSTSALISNTVTSPTTASSTIGTPHSTTAIHARSNGSGCHLSRLHTSAMPPMASSAMPFFVPPSSRSCSSFSIVFSWFRLAYTVGGIGYQEGKEKAQSFDRAFPISCVQASAHVREALHGFREVLNRLAGVAVLDPATHAMLDVPLEHNLAAAVQG